MLRIDREVFDFCLAFRSPAVTLLMMLITILGEELMVLIAAALFSVISYTRSREYFPGVLLTIVGLSSIATNRSAKRIFMTVRPPLKYMVIPLTDPGFPSAHAMNSLAVYNIRFCTCQYSEWSFLWGYAKKPKLRRTEPQPLGLQTRQ